MYNVLVTIHNIFGGLTLLLTLAAGVLLLATARTTSQGAALVLRGALISASIQALLGIVMVLYPVFGGSTQILPFWLHYLLGLVTVGVVSAITARARRSPDSEARRYGGILLGVFALVLVTFLVGQFKITI
jgi:heme A synthase